MKKGTKAIIAVVFSFMFVFLNIGYAAVSVSLTVDGEVTVTPPETIYITSVGTPSSAVFTANPTVSDSPSTKFTSDLSFTGTADVITVTFDVTVFNNSGVDQIYDTVIDFSDADGYDAYTYSNYISCTTNVAQGTVVPDGESRVFTVTYTYDGKGNGVSIRHNPLYELRFTLDPEDLTQQATKGIADRFKEILNGEADGITYTYTENGQTQTVTVQKENLLSTLQSEMENNEGWLSSGGYISNVPAADPDDNAFVSALFGENSTMNIGGKELPVTVLVKEQDITTDGNGNEMVLYVTTDTLQTGGKDVPVYALVFGQVDPDADGTYEWQQLGGMLAGEAAVSNYSGNNTSTGIGSFSTDYWASTEYDVTDDDNRWFSSAKVGEIDEAYDAAKAAANN